MTRRPERPFPDVPTPPIVIQRRAVPLTAIFFGALLVILGGYALWLASSLPTGLPERVNSPSIAPSIAQPQPTIQVVIVWPSPTPSPSPTPKPTPQPTATAQPVCSDDTAFGDVCVMVKPTIRQPKTFVWCTPEWSGLCRWPGPDTVSAKVETE